MTPIVLTVPRIVQSKSMPLNRPRPLRHSIRVPPQPLRRTIHLPLEPTPAPAQEPELASAPEPEMTEQERELLRAGKAGGDAGAARQFVAKPSPDRAHHLLRHVCKVVLQDRAPVRGTNGNYRGRRADMDKDMLPNNPNVNGHPSHQC